MRAIRFMMIDYIKVRQQLYFMLLFIVIAATLGYSSLGAFSSFSYMMFIALIYATAPFGACKRGDAGFLVLLPSTVTHRVLGRFLYGISFVGIAFVISGVMTVIYQMMGQKIELWMVAAGLLLLAFCLFVITVEFLILYLVGEHMAPQMLGIVRTVPAMASFFAMIYLMGEATEEEKFVSIVRGLEDGLLQMGCIAVAVALAVLAVAIAVCVKVTGKRDYV